MTCEETRPLIHAYNDGELDLRTSLEVEQHLSACAACTRESNNLVALGSALKQAPLRYDAPAGLRVRLRSSIRADSRATDGIRRWPLPALALWRWPVSMAVAAALIVVILRGAIPGSLFPDASSSDALGHEVVASHIRSLMANHLADVLSSNQHTVKPWFDGKLDFAPSVQDFSAQGFALAGGRLDYLDGRPVAALVYRHRLHIINLFTWPAKDRAPVATRAGAIEGYNTRSWSHSGMNYWAISDVAPDTLAIFAQLVRDHDS